jgi:hypothetical protein
MKFCHQIIPVVLQFQLKVLESAIVRRHIQGLPYFENEWYTR